MAYCVANEPPFASVNVCPASVNTGTSSTVALNSNSRSLSLARSSASVNDVVPSLTNIGTISTGLLEVADVLPSNEIGCEATLLPVGSVAPVAAIVNAPEPSDLIVAPPRSI